jgi:hypothetical protein
MSSGAVIHQLENMLPLFGGKRMMFFLGKKI